MAQGCRGQLRERASVLLASLWGRCDLYVGSIHGCSPIAWRRRAEPRFVMVRSSSPQTDKISCILQTFSVVCLASGKVQVDILQFVWPAFNSGQCHVLCEHRTEAHQVASTHKSSSLSFPETYLPPTNISIENILPQISQNLHCATLYFSREVWEIFWVI